MGTEAQGNDPGITCIIWDKSSLYKRVGGREDRLNRMVGFFIEGMPARINSLQKAIVNSDVEEVLDLAHAIKGVVANLGGVRMLEVSIDMELAAKLKDLPGIEKHMVAMNDAYQALRLCIAEDMRP